MISTAWNTYVQSRYNKLVYLIWGGNSLINKNTGQTSVVDDLKRATPSVFMVKEIFAGLLCWQRKPPGLQCWRYSRPSYISLIFWETAEAEPRQCCRPLQKSRSKTRATSFINPPSWRNMYILHGQVDTWKHIRAHYNKMYSYTFKLLF